MTAQLPSREILQKIIETANEIITVNNGTNEDIWENDTATIISLYDRLNDDLASPSVVKVLAEFALAAHEQEPVAWMLNDPEFNHSVATKAGHTLEFYRSKGWGIEPLFTHPEPVHAVPGEMTIKQAARDYFGGFGSYMAYRDGFNACRAFMLNGGKS